MAARQHRSYRPSTRLPWRIAIAAATLLTGLACFGQNADACSCGAPELAQRVENSDLVFHGRVQSLRYEGCIYGVVRVTFDLLEGFKGVLPGAEVVSFNQVEDDSVCGYDFEEGREYLVFARNNGLDDLCNPVVPCLALSSDCYGNVTDAGDGLPRALGEVRRLVENQGDQDQHNPIDQSCFMTVDWQDDDPDEDSTSETSHMEDPGADSADNETAANTELISSCRTFPAERHKSIPMLLSLLLGF